MKKLVGIVLAAVVVTGILTGVNFATSSHAGGEIKPFGDEFIDKK